MKITTLKLLTLIIWLLMIGVSEAQLNEIILDESIGDTLDLAERNKYELFKDVEEFEWAVFYVDKDSTVYAKVCSIEDNETEIRTFGYGPINELKSQINEVNNYKFFKPRLIIRVSTGIGFYSMNNMKNAYQEASQISSSWANDEPGSGQNSSYSVSWFLNNRFAVGADLRKMNDGYKTSTASSIHNWAHTTSYLDVKAEVYEVTVTLYKAKAKSKSGVYYKLGIGYGSLDMTSTLRSVTAKDKAFSASIMLGAESGLFWNYFKLELNLGFQRLKFNNFSLTNIDVYQYEDLSRLGQILVDFYTDGTVDFSGGFIGVSVAAWIF